MLLSPVVRLQHAQHAGTAAGDLMVYVYLGSIREEESCSCGSLWCTDCPRWRFCGRSLRSSACGELNWTVRRDPVRGS